MNKRVSAVANLVEPNLYRFTAGCDVDSQLVVIAVYNDDTGAVEVREYPQHQEGARRATEWLKQNNTEIAILESTANFHQLFYENFRNNQINAQVINPITIKALLAVEGKSDKADAINMARLAAHFRLRTSNMPDDVQKELRMNLRKRDRDKQHRSRVCNSMRSMMTAHKVPIFRRVNPNSPSGIDFATMLARAPEVGPHETVQFAWKGRRSVKPELVTLLENAPLLPDYVREELDLALRDLQHLNELIDTRRRRAESHIEHFGLEPQLAWMTTAPAVSQLLALRIIAEAGADFHARYHSAEAFSKACGLAPANLVSAGKVLKSKKGQGNHYIKLHFISAVRVWMAKPKNEALYRWGLAYKLRAGYKRMCTAVAHKSAKSLWHMGRQGGVSYAPKTLRA